MLVSTMYRHLFRLLGITFLVTVVLYSPEASENVGDRWRSDQRCTSTNIAFSDEMAAVGGTQGQVNQAEMVLSLLAEVSADDKVADYELDCLRELAVVGSNHMLTYYFSSKAYAEIDTLNVESKNLINRFLAELSP